MAKSFIRLPSVKSRTGKSKSGIYRDVSQGVTVAQLENVRRKLRSLVQLIERTKRKIVYTTFDDELGEEIVIPLPEVPVGVDIERLRAKAQEFLKKHEQDGAVQRLKWNEPLTPEDPVALEEIFIAEGTSSASIEEAKRVSHGIGLFVRSLVGLDRAAANVRSHRSWRARL